MNRREVLKSTFGALALASGIAPAQNAIAQTRRRAALPAAGTPDYARLSNAVLNSHGLAAGNVWTRTNTGTLKSDDLVRASLLLRLTADHFEEIGVNAYLNTQLSQPPSGTISPDAVHAIGERMRSYGILLTDAQIQSMYPADVNAIERGRLYATQVGIRGVQVQIADSLDLAAKQLRLQEIATACGLLLPQLPLLPSPSPQASGLSPHASTACSDAQARVEAASALAEAALTAYEIAEAALPACLVFPPSCPAAEAAVVALQVIAAGLAITLAILVADAFRLCG